MDLIKKSFHNMARNYIKDGITNSDVAMKMLYEENENFKTDEIFLSLFPTIFNIEYCEMMIAKAGK